ncbi:MAG: polysaccharide deacetylase family protein [Acidobacteriota bacterium]|nr:polysaccharide deacetylase family protein [Acidobacteriota bacterium]
MSFEMLILGLHRVGTPPPTAKIRGLFISPQLLEFQLSLLQEMNFRFLTLSEAMREQKGKIAVLTFDDGYEDTLINGLPVLRKFKAPATIFVITNDVGKRNVIWEEAGEDLPADLLSWSSLEILHREGWEIGSHCDRHIHLSRYTVAEQKATIRKSIQEIKERLGFAPTSFAYPYGESSEMIKSILLQSGIKYAVTTEQTLPSDLKNRTDFLALPRVSLGGRKPHHYVKNLLRISKATGASAVLPALLKSSITGLQLNHRKSYLPKYEKF